MDYANDNNPPGTLRIRATIPVLALALLISAALWFVIGLAAWRAFIGWLQAL